MARTPGKQGVTVAPGYAASGTARARASATRPTGILTTCDALAIAAEQSVKQQRAVLLILLATCERALEAFRVAENVSDATFVEDLERIMSRTRRELEALPKP